MTASFLGRWERSSLRGARSRSQFTKSSGSKRPLSPGAAECIAQFIAGLDRFYAQDWDGAEAIFKKCTEIEEHRPGHTPGVKTNPSLVYLEIIEEFRSEPPGPDWDGSYEMKEK